jgi:hypothetical protein
LIIVNWEAFVSDEDLAFVVGVGEHLLRVLGLGILVNLGESFEFNIVHAMVLSKFNNDRVFDTILLAHGVITSVDLTEGPL